MPCSEESDVPADEELRPNVRASDDANVGAEKLRESSIGKVLMKKVITQRFYRHGWTSSRTRSGEKEYADERADAGGD